MKKLIGTAQFGRSYRTAARFIVFLLVCAVTAAAPALAVEYPEWNGDGGGYYTIDSPAAFAIFRDWINGNMSKDQTYRLTEDIDLEFDSHNKNWTPIGTTTDTAFTGTFEGNGHTVSNFGIVSSDYTNIAAGLFGYVEKGSVSDLGVTDFVISVDRTGSLYAGGLVGQLSRSGSSVMNSYAAGVVSASSSESTNAGGLVGRAGISSSVTDSHAAGSVFAFSSSASSSLSQPYAGGLVGYVSSSTIKNSYASSDVSARATGTTTSSSPFYACAGGLVGRLASDSSVTDSRATGGVFAFSSFSSSSPSASPSYVCAGGLVGHMMYTSSVTDSYATGSISISSSSSSSSSFCAGGLVGYISGSSVTNSYAAGSVSADSPSTSNAGGLAGYLSGAASSVKNSCATGGVFASSRAVTTLLSNAGGLVGYMSGTDTGTGSSVTNSYAAGSVSASSTSSATSNAGGLVGYMEKISSVTDSYAVGRVSASGSSPKVGGLVGNRTAGEISGGFFDRQGTGRSRGVGSGSSDPDGVTDKSNAEMFDVLSMDQAWTTKSLYYPQIEVLTSRDCVSLDIRQMSAFSAVPARFESADLAANEDTSFAVAHSIRVPAWTASADDTAEMRVTWTCSPDFALKSADWESFWLLAPSESGGLIDGTGKVFGSVDLTAKVTTSSGKTLKREFPLFFEGCVSDYVFSLPPEPDRKPGPPTTPPPHGGGGGGGEPEFIFVPGALTATHTFPETPQGALRSVKPFKCAIVNTENIPIEILLWGDNAENFLLYEESEETGKSTIQSITIGANDRKNFRVVPRLNLDVGNYTVEVAARWGKQIAILYKLSLSVTDGSGDSGVKRVTISQETLEMEPGDTRTLYARLSPAPGDLAACDAHWEVVPDESEPDDVVIVAPDELNWPDVWSAENAGAGAADAGALARSKLVVTANRPGKATVKARLTPLPSSREAPEGVCVVTVSAPRGASNGGGGGGCSAPLSGGAGAAFFTLAAALLIKKARR